MTLVKFSRRLVVRVLLCFMVGTSSSVAVAQVELPKSDTLKQELLEPFEVDCAKIAFYPDRWKSADVDFKMLAWEGKNIVFLTKKGDYDTEKMTQFVAQLDRGWDLYRELLGATPRQFKNVKGKPTICAIPKSNLSCGYGCGYVGFSGIEATAFYSLDWPEFQRKPESFKHYYFYEMGRNYFLFGERHSLFTTGYAVFMRYVCMDELGRVDNDKRTRETIENCEQLYADSSVGFFDAFTNFGAGEKRNRLKDKKGRTVSPSDQPVMYATAMLKLRNDYGGKEFVRRFYHLLSECKPYKATNLESAKPQCFNWLVCASAAAKKDLSNIFADRWRMPLTASQRKILSDTKWDTEDFEPDSVVEKLIEADR